MRTILGMITCGCIPVPYFYYEPVAPEGKLVHSLCAETAPKDTIEFEPNGSKVTVWGHSMGLSITVPIPEQKICIIHI